MDIKRELNDRGHALDMGCRDFERIVKVAALSDTSGDAEKGKPEVSDRTIAYEQRDPRCKFARWIQELEGLDYEIQYVQGTNNSGQAELSIQSVKQTL